MKLSEVGQELIPAGEAPREVEGELLGPKANTAVSQLSADLVDNWVRALQKEWARGMKDDERYAGMRMGEFMKDEMKRLDAAIAEVGRQVRRKTYDVASERAERWGGESRLR